jgi:hypothetical protein
MPEYGLGWHHLQPAVGRFCATLLQALVKNCEITEGNYAKSKRLVDYRKEQRTEKGEIYRSSISIFIFDCIKKLQQVERVRFTGRIGSGAPIEEKVFTSAWENEVAGTPNDS